MLCDAQAPNLGNLAAPDTEAMKCSATALLCTLPVAVLGIFSVTKTLFGILKAAKFFLQNSMTSASVTASPSLATTAALTSSPYFSSGIPNATASFTAGNDSSTESTSAGDIFSPDAHTKTVNRKFKTQDMSISEIRVKRFGTAAVDELLDSAHEKQIPLLVEVSEVASVKPPEPESAFVCLRIVFVAPRHAHSSNTNLALDAGSLRRALLVQNRAFLHDRQPDGARFAPPTVRQRVRRHHVRCLRHRVGFEHRCAECLLHALQYRRRQRRAAAPDEAQSRVFRLGSAGVALEENLVDCGHGGVPGGALIAHVLPESGRRETPRGRQHNCGTR
eukprot:TRINITY_DN871_c0_g1_i3.p2 TRINITY_DN871_c0_g1~~TRINITY_DN871_c0_g1_i3.p2  ORF type:complete len:333 (-),score=-29.46 TRINITY_DN871_c0_g1_i3:1146-2144(-)